MSLIPSSAVPAFGASSAAEMEKHAAACSSTTAQAHRLPSTRNSYAAGAVPSAGVGAGAGAPSLFGSGGGPSYRGAATQASLGVAGAPASAGTTPLASRPSPSPATSVMYAYDAAENRKQDLLHPQQQQIHQRQAHQHQQQQSHFQEQLYQHQQCVQQQQQQASAGGGTALDSRIESMKGMQATTPQQPPRPPANLEEKLRIREKYKQRLQERNVQIYQNALEEVMRKEREEAAKRAIFKINCPTRFGQNVHLVGSHATLGEWGVERAVPMTWGAGNIWSVELKLPRDASSFEYKYIIKEGPHVIWEPGQNHTLGVEKLRKAAAANAARQLSSTDSAYVIEDCWGVGT